LISGIRFLVASNGNFLIAGITFQLKTVILEICIVTKKAILSEIRLGYSPNY